ncbi:hypothetical protein [Haloprofundus salilacus]|uniref:hypothetical protein n=1 Tax=Haloprofundus salilacus TaxID=2876190 RepID=UPI001CCC3D37|nr:hypothetical protein [Haloprofundus salilacus]
MTQRLSRRDALQTSSLAIAGGLPLAGCLRAPTNGEPDGPLVDEGFESPLDGWKTRAAIGSEVSVDEFEWTVERSDERADGGDWSLRIFTEGDHDDGVAWAVRPVELDAERTETFRVSVNAWSESESFNTLRNLTLYLGPEEPTREEDFPAPGETGAPTGGGLREPLHQTAGWHDYGFEWSPEHLRTDRLYLAVGVAVVWEADATHFVDNVRVVIV